MARIGLEAGPLSQWLFAGLKAAGLPVELLETRHVRAAFKAMPVKTDRTDARGIAQLMRLGWFRPVHCKSLPAQEVRALLTTRKLLQAKRHDVEMSLRGVLRGFGLKVGPTTPKTFEGGCGIWWLSMARCRRSPMRSSKLARCSSRRSRPSRSASPRWPAAMPRPAS
jgi:transposase